MDSCFGMVRSWSVGYCDVVSLWWRVGHCIFLCCLLGCWCLGLWVMDELVGCLGVGSLPRSIGVVCGGFGCLSLGFGGWCSVLFGGGLVTVGREFFCLKEAICNVVGLVHYV